MTNEEFIARVIESLENGTADIQTDNEGQLVIYTGVYEQADTSLSEKPDPNFSDETAFYHGLSGKEI